MSSYDWSLPTFVPPITAPSTTRSNSLLGKGLAWPLRMDSTTNDFARVVDESNVDQCVLGLILTSIGERMDPLVGSVIPEVTFEESDVLADLAQPSILTAITRNEPRVKIVRLSVTNVQFPGGGAGIVIRMAYVIRATNQRKNLVYPYAIPNS